MTIPLLVALAAATAPACPTIDLMPDWRAFLSATADDTAEDRAKAAAERFIPAHQPYYRPPPADPTKLVRGLTQWFADAGNLNGRPGGITPDQVAARFPAAMARFQKAFPDFRCRSTVMLGVSFGSFDGQARNEGGTPLLLFGTDVIARLHDERSLPVLFDHELFHLYHAQVAPPDMREPADGQTPVIVNLWSEGLASWVSRRMNPGATLPETLWFPRDLAEQVDRRRPELARRLLADIRAGAKGDAAAARWFDAGENAEGYPPRAGYYLGYLLAGRLAKGRTPAQLARLDRRTVERAAIRWLEKEGR